jgi:GH15 family glucan-1,4-alpha-glucosidase
MSLGASRHVIANTPAFRHSGMSRRYPLIEDHALIGNGLTASLVDRDGAIDWACFPRFDSGSVFGRILDADRGGLWAIRPSPPYTTQRGYADDTNVLRTWFRTAGGEVELVDFMPPPLVPPARSSESTIVRIVRGRRGSVDVGIRFDPRFDYGRQPATWTAQPGGGVRAAAGRAVLTLNTNVPLEIGDAGAEGRWRVRPAEEYVFVLTFREAPSALWHGERVSLAHRLLQETEGYWRQWIRRCAYRGEYADRVHRSALVLKLLDYAPTGAIVAAPTTSLPEKLGGVRNWDYRYSWIRDTAFTLYALYGLGYREEGEAFLDWVLDVAGHDPASVQVVYGIGGETAIEEHELGHLEGYEGSRPVRIGNAAHAQKQLDIYGEILDCAFLFHKHGGSVSAELWEFLQTIVDYVCRVWTEPDQGLWEVRSGPRHFVYSKALCWVAVDRGLRLARATGRPADVERWERVAEHIHAEVLARGYDRRAGTFTQAYDHPELDASALALLLRNVLPASDPRMVSSVDRVVDALSDDGFLLRYAPRVDDGLPGGEGAFLMCSFWLADCYAEMGRLVEARMLFERLLAVGNDVGLYAEELDPSTGRHLGNFPQAFTHVALINAALSLERATARARRAGSKAQAGRASGAGDAPGRLGASTG